MFIKRYCLKYLPVLLLTLGSSLSYAQDKSNISYVDPFIGTTKSNVLTSWGGNGGTYPGAVAPSGNIQISPETRITGAKGYDYADNSIYYFSCIKHYSGFPEGSSGHIFIMPVIEGQAFEMGQYNRQFSHKDEVAVPGYYKITFKDNNTTVEASAGKRTGILRFTFPINVTPQIFIGDLEEISFVGKRIVKGSLANTVINWNEDIISHKKVKGGYLLTFKEGINKAKVIVLKVSTSTVNFAGAQRNIESEIKQFSFDQFRERINEEWKIQLSTVTIQDSSIVNKTNFYTALYHSLLIPWVVSDADGQYKGADNMIHKTTGTYEYGGFSPWDTFRSLHPLLTLLYPEKQNDVILSMLNVYKQTGHLPTESMTGNHAVPIIVDSYLKGVKGYDYALAYTAMKKSIMEAPFAKNDMEIYHDLGYVPFSRSESVTRTVEYAYDDWALSQYAKVVMNNRKDGEILRKRGLNYRNLFHPADLFMLPRMDTVFRLNPGMNGYKEGNKWIYTYFVPHNAKDLINLLGGNMVFADRLDSAMNTNVILYDNETVTHLPYLFNAAGYPALTQKWCREIMINRFSATPGGLPGNDDLGSMSSAYIFNAMGVFPVSPGKPQYAIGAPLFSSMTFHLANKKQLIIKAQHQSPVNKYVKSLTVNGKPYEQLVISHDLLVNSGTLEYEMSKDSMQAWPKDRNPIALSDTKTAAEPEIVNYTISKTTVEPNEEFWIKFQVKNTGSLGTKKVIVYANGKPWLSKNCLVQPGAMLTDSISCRLYAIGKIKLGVNLLKGIVLTVIEPNTPVAQPFTISGLTVKPIVEINEEQHLTYQIKNLTGKTRGFDTKVMLEGMMLYTDTINLLPGEQKTVNHTFIAQKAGLKSIKVFNEEVNYKVYDTATASLLLKLDAKKTNGNHVVDQSGFGNDAIIEGMKAGPSANTEILIGDSCYLEIPNSASLDMMKESITMMAWVYPEATETGLVDMLTKGDSHVLQTGDNKTLTFFAGGWGRGDCTVKLPADWKLMWHHIAGVCKGGILSVYIDGRLAGTSKVDGTVNLSNTSKWQIGRNEEFPSERVFHGKMDKVSIFEQPLSADEISAIVVKEQK